MKGVKYSVTELKYLGKRNVFSLFLKEERVALIFRVPHVLRHGGVCVWGGPTVPDVRTKV